MQILTVNKERNIMLPHLFIMVQDTLIKRQTQNSNVSFSYFIPCTNLVGSSATRSFKSDVCFSGVNCVRLIMYTVNWSMGIPSMVYGGLQDNVIFSTATSILTSVGASSRPVT